MYDIDNPVGGLVELVISLAIGAVVTAMIVNVSVAIVRQAYATVDLAKAMSEQTAKVEEVMSYAQR